MRDAIPPEWAQMVEYLHAERVDFESQAAPPPNHIWRAVLALERILEMPRVYPDEAALVACLLDEHVDRSGGPHRNRRAVDLRRRVLRMDATRRGATAPSTELELLRPAAYRNTGPGATTAPPAPGAPAAKEPSPPA